MILSVIITLLAILLLALYFKRKRETTLQDYLKKVASQITSPLKGSKILFLVNPNSGSRTGLKIYHEIVSPLFSLAGVETELIQTKGKGHARELMSTMDLSPYEGVVCMSGDGLFYEVINGFGERGTNDKEWARFFKSLRFGLIPCGTSNGLATSLGFTDPVQATLKILTCSRSSVLDLCQIIIRDKKVLWDAHVITWAFVSHVNQLMENRIRWLPSFLRETFSILFVIAMKPSTRGTLYFVPVDTPDPKLGYSDHRSLPDWPENPNFKYITSDFLLFVSANVSHASSLVIVSPHAQPSDGSVDLVIVKENISRRQMIQAFLMMQNGSHLSLDFIQIYKVKEWILEPKGHGYLDASGESLEYGKIQVVVKKGMLSLLN